MVKLKVKNRQIIVELVGVLLIPFAVFWILYRFGVWKIIDALAIAVIIGTSLLLALKLLVRARIITFGGKTQ